MNHKERRDLELPYISDEEIMKEQTITRKIVHRLNTMDPSDFERIKETVKELLGKSEGAFINPPFYCDYGSHIEVGKNFFANYNCTILDVAKVVIGDNCQMAPNVAIYTAGHPLHPDSRNSGYEYGISVTIGATPQTHANTVFSGLLHHIAVLFWILGAEFLTLQITVTFAGAVKIARIPGIDLDLHTIGFF